MAQPFTFEIKGLKELQARFKNMPKKIEDEIRGELQDGANEIELRAKRDAPGDTGFLRNGISSSKVGPLTFQVVSAVDYSAYVEFGTRSKTNVPAGLDEFAQQYKGGGGKGNAKEAIYEWCRRKGIEEKFWWSIYISVMTKGIEPHPYFFKNFIAVRPQIVANVKRVIESL